MEPIVSAIASSRDFVKPQRADDPAPASKQREETRVEQREETRVASAGPVQADEKPSARDVHRAAERLNIALQEFNRDLSISVHKDTGIMVVKVTDSNGEVIRQMPPEQLLQAEVNIEKIVGLFVNDIV